MSLTSIQFLGFLSVLFIVYYLIPKKFQWMLLLVGSYYFYLLANIKLAMFLGITTTTIYACGRILGRISLEQKKWIAANSDKSKEERKIVVSQYVKRKKWALIATLTVNLGILAFLKYFNFFALNANRALTEFGFDSLFPELYVVLPLGISFYTFQAISYLIDVYRGTVQPEKNVAKLALFISFFPTVLQGPISRFGDLGQQLFSGHSFDYNQVKFGLQRMAWGFFKKLVIADRIAIVVNQVYGNWHDYSGFQLVCASILFAFQIYTDFSGFIDIVIGAAQVLGIRITENFQTPFFSKSISEYWRRWHISLGTWFKDYLFFPMLKSGLFQNLNKNLKKIIGKKPAQSLMTYIAMFILWFTIGLWHGPNWKFIIGSGILHWFYIVLGEICLPVNKKIIKGLRLNTEAFSFHLFQQIRTFILVCIGFVFFRADSASVAIEMLKKMANSFFPLELINQPMIDLGFDYQYFIILFSFLIVLFVISLLQQKYSIREKLAEQNFVFRWIIYFMAIFVIFVWSIKTEGNAGQFIYFQF